MATIPMGIRRKTLRRLDIARDYELFSFLRVAFLFAGLFGSEELSRAARSCFARPRKKIAENCH